MAATMAPVVEIVFDNVITVGGTDEAIITLPTNSSYFLLGVVVTGTAGGPPATTLTVASDGNTLINAAQVGASTIFVPCNSFDPATGTVVVSVGGGGTITYCSLLLRGDVGRSLTIVVQ